MLRHREATFALDAPDVGRDDDAVHALGEGGDGVELCARDGGRDLRHDRAGERTTKRGTEDAARLELRLRRVLHDEHVAAAQRHETITVAQQRHRAPGDVGRQRAMGRRADDIS